MLGQNDDVCAIPGIGATRSPTNFLRRTIYSTTAGSYVWNKGYGTSAINVIVQGGGAAGNTTGSGGQGGLAIGFLDATNINQVTVTIALAGTSSFGSFMSATGGVTNGAGGTASGGDINFNGQGGSVSPQSAGGGIGGGAASAVGLAGVLGGGGGGGNPGGSGSVGYVIVEEYS